MRAPARRVAVTSLIVGVAAGQGDAEQQVAGTVGHDELEAADEGAPSRRRRRRGTPSRRRPPRHVQVTATVASTTAPRRSLTTCTSSAISWPGARTAGSGSVITTTGRQASTTACHASLGARSWSSTDAEIIGAGSASQEKQKPPVGRYFRRRSVSMWWRRTAAWLRCVAVRHEPNVG